MEQKKCPVASGTTRLPCFESGCNLWADEECVFNGMAKNLKEISQEIKEIKHRVNMI
jgi:hypothetical protein